MPNYSRIDPAAATNAFARQVQLGANMRANDQSEEMNALALDQARKAAQPQYDPQAFQKVGDIAANILTIGDPIQRKAAFKQSILQNGPLFDTLGMPHADALTKVDASDDATLEQTLTALAQRAPRAAPQKLSAGESLVSQRGDGTYGADYTAPSANAEANGFTLSEGQQRFDSKGNPIASVAPRPKEIDPQQQAQIAATLRDDFRNDSKVFLGVADAMQRVNDSASDPSGAGDVALLYNYLKVLDPASTVREGEFQTVGSSGGLPTQVQGFFNKMVNGKLPDTLRGDIVDRATRLYKGQEARYKTQVLDKYLGLGKRYGVDPSEFSDPRIPQAAAPGGAAPQRLTPEQAAALPPGTPFIGMDGQPRVRN